MRNNILFGAIALSCSAFTLAASPEGYMTDSGISIKPVIDAGLKYDDNIFSEGSATTGSNIFTIAPAVSLLLDDGVNNYSLDLGIESGTYIDSSDDNYLTANIAFNSHLEASSQSRFDIVLGMNSEIEPRGTGITEGLGDAVDEPLSYDDHQVGLTYEYGALSSSARIAVTGEYYNKDYTNFTEITEFRSYDEPALGATVFYTTNASTDAFFELKGSSKTYDLSGAISKDSDIISALVGITWEATALTTGSFKIGQEQKDFTDGAREDFKGISWEGNVDWSPLTYTTLSLNTSRSAKDPDIIGDYITESVYGANWLHNWSEVTSSNIYISYMHEDYTGIDRLDETISLNADITLRITRSTNVALFVEYQDKDSTDNTIVFDKSVLGFNLTITL